VRRLSQVERIFLLVPFAGSAQGKQYRAAEKAGAGILQKAGAKLESVDFSCGADGRVGCGIRGPIA